MKKIVLCLFAAALTLLGTCALAEANLTLLVYMCGADLQSAACEDIYEMLMMDISDDEMMGYVDLGLMRNNLVDWESGTLYSLFDGTWPIFGDQLVPLYDQMSNEYGRRSLIPVKLNGEHTYLVVEFPAGSAEGRVLGANAGYDDNGLPIRNTTQLKPGDSIVPVYTMYVYAEDGDEPEEAEFDGDEFPWQDGMTVTYQDLGDDEEEALEMLFCFVLNDVFGGYDLTEVLSFEV